MLTIMRDPAGVTGRERHRWDLCVSMQENIARHLDAGGDCTLRINGQEADPYTDPRLDRAPHPDDQVVVVRRPGYGTEWLMYVYYVAVIAMAIYSIANRPSMPDSSAGKDSPNNKLTGQTNVARAYQAIPDVYGYRRVWPDLIQPSTVEYVDNVKFVTEWLCISRGKGGVEDVRYAETPLADIDGSSYEIFEPVPAEGYPEFGSTTILDVNEAFASDDVNGQELPYAADFAPFTQAGTFNAASGATTFTITLAESAGVNNLKLAVPSGTASVQFSFESGLQTFFQTCTVLSFIQAGPNVTFTLSCAAWGAAHSGSTNFTIDQAGFTSTTVGPFTLPRDADRIWWNLNFLRGLKGTVVVKIEWWRIDGNGDEVPGSRESVNDSYTNDTFDQLYYTRKVTPSAGLGRYRIQYTRLSGPNGSQGTDVAKLQEVYAVRYYAQKVLPGVTALRVTTKATLSATGFSDRKFNVRWRRHVRTLTSATLSASRNFGRIIAHIWTIARNDIAGLDVDAFAELNAQHGEDSPMLRFDGSLDDADMSLGERMQLVAGTCRGAIWRDGTKWTVTRDQARQHHDLQLDYRNLAASGESTIGVSSVLPASFDGVEIEYVDEATQSKKSYVRLDISSGMVAPGQSMNPKKVQLMGCTTLAQANNRAQLEARKLLYQRTSVSDNALSDALSLGPGSKIRWIDPNDFAGDDGLQAGEVIGIAGSTIATSEPLDWKGETEGRIVFTGVDGLQLGSPVRCTPAPGGALLASMPEGIYTADDVRQLGSRYAFGVGLTEAELEAAGMYTVTDIKPGSDGTVSLSFANYDDRFYEADTT